MATVSSGIIKIAIEGLPINVPRERLSRAKAAVQEAVVGSRVFNVRVEEVRVTFPVVDLFVASRDDAPLFPKQVCVWAGFGCERIRANSKDDWQDIAERIGIAVRNVFCDERGLVTCNVHGVESGCERIWKSHP